MNEKEFSILVVDDDPSVRKLLVNILNNVGYSVFDTGSPEEALHLITEKTFHLVLSDIVMPELDGLKLLKKIRDADITIPVILLTAYPDLERSIEALKHGANDFIIKPFKVDYIVYTVKKALSHYGSFQVTRKLDERLASAVRERTRELERSLTFVKSVDKELIERFMIASECKGKDNISHIKRMGLYSRLLAESLGMPSDFVEDISYASPMHDIGKIGMPDEILMKPEKLTPVEEEIVRTHPVIGYEILEGSSFSPIQMGASVALTHHERWDGSGYPKGLKGDEIPIEGRIVMLIDLYDTLRDERPYKRGMSHRDAYRIITKGDDRTKPDHFDPDVLNSFKKVNKEFEKTFVDNDTYVG